MVVGGIGGWDDARGNGLDTKAGGVPYSLVHLIFMQKNDLLELVEGSLQPKSL